jgi:hypothetical protein
MMTIQPAACVRTVLLLSLCCMHACMHACMCQQPCRKSARKATLHALAPAAGRSRRIQRSDRRRRMSSHLHSMRKRHAVSLQMPPCCCVA